MPLTLIIALAYTALVPAIVGSFKYRSYPYEVRALVWLFIASVISEVLATALRATFLNNMVVIYWYTLIECWLVTLFVSSSWPLRTISRLVYPFGPIVVTIIGLVEYSLHPMEYASVTRGTESMIIIIALVQSLQFVLDGRPVKRISYLLTGILFLYFLTGIVYFCLSRFVSGEPLLFIAYIHVVINALFNLSAGFILWRYSSKLSLFA